MRMACFPVVTCRRFCFDLFILVWCFFTGGVSKFPWDASPYELYNMKYLITKFINKYICFNNLFNVRGLKQRSIT